MAVAVAAGMVAAGALAARETTRLAHATEALPEGVAARVGEHRIMDAELDRATEALARDHILSWSNPGDVVLDPFLGSGTTGKMAVLTGRQFIGIDTSAEYVELTRRRIAKVEAQPFLFHPAETTPAPRAEQLSLV